MKKHIVKIMMLFALPALAVVSCDSYDRTEVVPTISVNQNAISLFVNEQMQLTASPATLSFVWSSTNDEIATVDANGLVTAIAEGAASIVCKSGDISFSTEVVVQKKVEMTAVTLRCGDAVNVNLGTTYLVNVDTEPFDANDIPLDDFAWWSDNEDIARVSDAGVIKAISYGVTTIHYRRGHFNCQVEVTVPEPTPFFGEPQVISATEETVVWMRDYDMGGQNVAFYDTAGGSPGNYRRDRGDDSGRVCVEGGGNIGYVANGEWLIYTLNIEQAGTYTVTVLANSGSGAGARGKYHFELDGKRLTDTNFAMESTGGWGSKNGLPEHNGWPHTDVDVELPAGVHKFKMVMDQGNHNIFQMKFNKK